MDKEVVVTTGWPPSVNHLWVRAGKRIFVSQKGIEFKNHVHALWLQHPVKLVGKLSIDVVAFPPDRRKRDIDNIFKVLLDSLMYAGYYEDDFQIDRLSVSRAAVCRPGRLEIVIKEL